MSEDARAGLRAAVEAHVCGYCHNRISYTPENDQWPIYQSKPCRTGGCAPLRAALAAAPVQGARGEGDRWPTDGETPATCPVCGIEWDSTDLRRHPRKPLPWWRCSDCGAEWNEIDRKAAAGR
jgi:hypothetical protein